ncbi:SLATT domain-containing protein [Niveibacterium terrae]|uniref:SLATT domain-containing protein n=1 Tax=Niveibacterium terrae TaxID=3373598 RepID=UPI003A90F983
MQTSFPEQPPARDDSAPCSAQRLQRAIRTSAHAHGFAGIRLSRKERAWQTTLVLLALGLVLLPLLQNAGVALALAPNVLNLIQVFLAVAVLIAIVLLASANLALRGRTLSECAERLRELSHEFDKVCEDLGPTVMPSHILDEFRTRHSETLRNIEAPCHNDHRQTLWAMASDYELDPASRLRLGLSSAASQLFSLALPLLLLTLEAFFIANALGLNHELNQLLGPAADLTMKAEPDLTLNR